MDYKWLRPSEISLDPQNPRMPDGTSSDKEAINRLLAEGPSQLLALARSLNETGEANPTELPIVVKDGSKYLVLEGNRRIAALKLIADPRLADSRSHQAALEKIRNSRKSPPKTLYCAVAKDREEADPWITMRHTGANDGVGVRVWSAEQTARHRQRMSAPVDSGTLRAIAIADELTEAYQADDDLVQLISKVRTERLTNIGRFFTGVTLTRMQFEVKQITGESFHTLWAKHTADQLHDYFRWAFHFLDTNPVDAFKNDTVRGNLLNVNAHRLPDPADSMPESERLADRPYSPTSSDEDESDDDAVESDDDTVHVPSHRNASSPSANSGANHTGDRSGGANPASGADTGRKRDQRDERSLYSAVKLTNLSRSVQRLLNEAKQLLINDHYATACVLARVLLELTVSDPKVLKWSGKKESDTLAEKIRGCIVKLDPDIDSNKKRTRRDLYQAHLETKEIGVAYLHQFMHNPAARSDPHLARRFSGVYTPLLNSINEAVK